MKDLIINIHFCGGQHIIPQQVIDGAFEYAEKHNVNRVNIYASDTAWTMYHGRARDCHTFRVWEKQ